VRQSHVIELPRNPLASAPTNARNSVQGHAC
jgi:hypothetical protein